MKIKTTIKKLFVQKSELLRAKKLINLIKLTRVNTQISIDRWIRQIIRRWRFISFVKISCSVDKNSRILFLDSVIVFSTSSKFILGKLS